MDHIVFLCQECGGDLNYQGVWWSGAKVWECAKCGLRWVYRGAGWERVG